MSHQHSVHKLLVILLLLALFCVPFIAVGVGGSPATAPLQGGLGVIGSSQPAAQPTAPPHAVALDQFAGNAVR